MVKMWESIRDYKPPLILSCVLVVVFSVGSLLCLVRVIVFPELVIYLIHSAALVSFILSEGLFKRP